jgi:hypothetical protein
MMNGNQAYPPLRDSGLPANRESGRVQSQTLPVNTGPRTPRVFPLADPVRVAIPVHQRAEGKHRLRVNLNRDIAHELARGLKTPRIHVTGDVNRGFRLWCQETGGYAPIPTKSGGWYIALSIRRVHGRERAVPTQTVPFQWDRDHHGPVLCIDPLPADFLPERSAPPHAKPSAKCPDTALANAFADAERRLAEAMDEQRHQPELPPPHARPVLTLPPKPAPLPMAEPEPAPALVDLRDAIGLVNELLSEAGDAVSLVVGDDGRLAARRRVVSYVEL